MDSDDDPRAASGSLQAGSGHPGYDGAFVLDPDGNHLEVVFHGPAIKSADSIRITC